MNRWSWRIDLFASAFTDPAPVLEASHTLEGRLQQLQSSAPDSEALVREISGHWKKHLECLEKTGQARLLHIRETLICCTYRSNGVRMLHGYTRFQEGWKI